MNPDLYALFVKHNNTSLYSRLKTVRVTTILVLKCYANWSQINT